MYAIVDIETTGLRVSEDRITEIAVYIHNGEEIVDSFHSLINPERYLPEYITQLTGISNEMLADAPKFYEIAKKIVKITEGKIFVAHNAHFDYTFIKNEFHHLGYHFQRKTLCTVRLSRKIFPGLPSYSLGKLCNYLKIPVESRHRAAGDAQATCRLFELLIQNDEQKIKKNIIDHEIKATNLPPKIRLEDFEALPEETGVYYFFDEEGNIIYIGKSKNIKKRVASHFATNLKSRKSIEFKNQVAQIDYQITGSELVALLLESDEIKKHSPPFNRAQRRSHFHYGIFSKIDKNGYIQLFADSLQKHKEIPIVVCQSAEGARNLLYRRIEEYQLCMKLCNLYQTKSACFDYQIKKCLGACIQLENPEAYNARVEEAIASFNYYVRKNLIITDRGRKKGEKAIVCIEKGKYLGFGYIDEYAQISHPCEAKDYIRHYADNRDTQKILNLWLKQNPRGVIEY